MPALSRLFATCLLVLVGCTPPPADEPRKAGADEAPAKASEAKPGAVESELPPLPDVIAQVEGHDILRSEFEVRYGPAAAQILARRPDGKVPAPYQAMQRETIIDKLIWSKLLELEAQRSGVDFKPEALVAIEAEEREHVRDWPAWLARVGQTVEVRHQLNIDYLRERALLEARIGSLEASEDELKAAFERERDKFVAGEEMIRASHLLVTYGPRVADEKIQPTMPDVTAATSPEELAKWDAAAKARAEALREQALVPGTDFNELARQMSEDPGASRGGDMGLFPRKQMVPEYADAAFALELGQISQPIRSAKGYYVIKSFGRYQAGPLPFEAVRADLVRAIESEKFKQAHAAMKVELEGRFSIQSSARDDARAFRAARAKSKSMPAPE